MIGIRAILLTLAPVVAVVALGSCSSDPRRGYTVASSHDETIQTVSVPMWGNSTYHHGLEASLTDALIKRIHSSTPWRVAPPESADASLTGEITNARLLKFSVNRDSGLSEEMGFEMTVDFEWKETQTGRVILARRAFRASETFVPALGAREPVGVAEQGAVDRLAKDIVASLRQAW